MAIAKGIYRNLRVKQETTFGTAAGATGAQSMRRVQSTLNLKKSTFESNEINVSQQVNDFRHGIRSVAGNISGELSPLTYQMFFAAALRKAFAAGGATTTQTTIAASASAPQITRSAGSFFTDGHKVGDVVRFTGFVATANNAKNFLITALTATEMTGIFLNGDAVTAEAEGASVSITMVGKKSFVPTTGHVLPSFSIEHWQEDIAQSELFLGCKVSNAAIKLPPSGMATVDFTMMGKDVTNATSAYFTSPTADTTTGIVAAANGAVYVGGVQVALLTGLDITIAGGHSSLEAVGAESVSDIVEGRVKVNGTMTAYFENATMRDYFINETEVSVIGAFTTDDTADADFVTFVMNRVKVGGADKDDGEKGITQTFPFTALLNTSGGTGTSTDATTIAIQDSQAA